MRIEIIAVGRARAGPERDLYNEWLRRIRWPVNLREIEEKRPLPADRLKAREAELLLAALPGDAPLVALDETGRDLSSQAFAERLGDWRDGGRPAIAFVIGGAGGLDPVVAGRADLVLSFGRQTWPHMLVRAMLAEQIYRAQQILAGHPYHRE
jgi:23S rRNA (pseudouridine1915-N3)-methyltransferase